MAGIVNSTLTLAHDTYDYYLWVLTFSDERTKGWLMVDSPVPTILNIMLYLFIVWCGPKLMRNRKPFKLKWLLVSYNLAITGLNFYITEQLYTAAKELKYNFTCQPYRPIRNPSELQMTNAIWWYYFSKLLEFCDTFFFILRKKDKQLTFLHVYHHSSMLFIWWIGVKWVPSGGTIFVAMVNSAIHVLMYLYYGLSALGPQVAKYLWWKKYLTILQLGQFATGVVLGINAVKAGCEVPVGLIYLLIVYTASFIVLFGDFYVKAYMKKGRQEFSNTDITGSGQAINYNDNKMEKKLK